MGLFNIFIVKCPHCKKEFEQKLEQEVEVEKNTDSNLIRLEINWIKRIKIWWNSYRQRTSNRIQYLKDKIDE